MTEKSCGKDSPLSEHARQLMLNPPQVSVRAVVLCACVGGCVTCVNGRYECLGIILEASARFAAHALPALLSLPLPPPTTSPPSTFPGVSRAPRGSHAARVRARSYVCIFACMTIVDACFFCLCCSSSQCVCVCVCDSGCNATTAVATRSMRSNYCHTRMCVNYCQIGKNTNL